MDKEFDYSKMWEEEEEEKQRRMKKEIETFSKGTPRKGIKGRYIKPKNYISRRSSIRAVKSAFFEEKKIE